MPCPPIPPSPSDAITFTPWRDPLAPGLLNDLPMPPKRIAVLKASRIGDMINTTPALRAIKATLPEAEITLITLPMLADLVQRLPYVDRYLPFPGYPGMADQFFDSARTLDFFRAAQEQGYDLAVQIQGTGVYSNPFLLMLGAQFSAGFIRPTDTPGRLDAALPWPETGHEIRRNLALVEFLGFSIDGEQTDFPLRNEDHQAAEKLLSAARRPWIGIHTSARDSDRRWPLDRFARAAGVLQARHGGTVLFIGEARDREGIQAAAEVENLAFLNLAGCTTLPVTGAVLTRLAVFLTNDTGPAHIAYALGAPVVTIFGSGDTDRNGPLQPGPFRVIAQSNHRLDTITVEEVIASAEQVMRS